jgi:hypothetical protein
LMGTSAHTEKDKIPSANSKILGSGSKSLTKGECLTAQAKNMVAMTRIFEGSIKARDKSLGI